MEADDSSGAGAAAVSVLIISSTSARVRPASPLPQAATNNRTGSRNAANDAAQSALYFMSMYYFLV